MRLQNSRFAGLFLFVFGLFFVGTNNGHASYLEICTLTVQVESVGTSTEPSIVTEVPFYTKELTYKVTAAETVPGSHADCAARWVDQVATKTVFFVNPTDADTAQPGHTLRLAYRYANWRAPSGPGQSESVFYESKAYLAYKAANENIEVTNAIQRLRQRFTVGDRQGLLGLGVDMVDLGCGFAGCDEVYMVTLKFGWNGVNAHFGSVVVLVPFAAVGGVMEDIRIIYESGADVSGGRLWKPDIQTLTKVKCGTTQFNQWTFEFNTQLSLGKAKYGVNGLNPLTCEMMKEAEGSFLVSCEGQEFILEDQGNKNWRVSSASYSRSDCSVPTQNLPFLERQQ